MKLFLASVLIFCIKSASAETCPDTTHSKIVCYYSSWAIYREGMGYFNATNIDANLCTHVVYSFAGLDINGEIVPLDPTTDISKGGYKDFLELKNTNPCLKTILAIGGWNEGSRKYSVMAASPGRREVFAESVLRTLATYGFDGVDLDWEYPTQRGGIPDDKDNFVQLLSLLKNKLSPWDLLLTLAVPVFDDNTLKAYDVEKIAPFVDYISLMAYDYTSATSKETGLISPITKIKVGVQYWINHKLPKEKLVLGVPTYGRSYKLADSNKTGVGAPVIGPGEPGEFTKEPGFLSYYELMTIIKSQKYTIKSDDKERNLYAFSKSEWITYDDPTTIKIKAQYVKSEGLGGVMLWSIDTDDFIGRFGKKYAILRTVNDEINKKMP